MTKMKKKLNTNSLVYIGLLVVTAWFFVLIFIDNTFISNDSRWIIPPIVIGFLLFNIGISRKIKQKVLRIFLTIFNTVIMTVCVYWLIFAIIIARYGIGG